MRILSPYDGMACGMLAMQAAGITVSRYVAYEIDKYAVRTSTHNFPMIEHRGDVFQADFTEFRGFDFVIGGSPCTYWSIAQTNNRETEASGIGWELFKQYVRAVKEAQPKYFIYENNKSMSKAIRESITQTFGFEPICINSALVSAQNRQRLYWVGKRNLDGTYSRVHVNQPKDLGVLIRDVLTVGIHLNPTISEKLRTVDSHMGKLENNLLPRMNHTNPAKQQYDCIVEPVLCVIECGTMKVREATKKGYTEIHPWECVDLTQPNSKTRRGRNMAEKSNCLMTSCQFWQYCGVLGYATPCEWDEFGRPIKAVSSADGKIYPVYEVKDGQITIKDNRYPVKLVDNFYITRKLTVKECMRLQTVPEWYEFPVADSQAYKMLGNGWTIEVIAHLIKATQTNELADNQMDLFKMAGVM